MNSNTAPPALASSLPQPAPSGRAEHQGKRVGWGRRGWGTGPGRSLIPEGAHGRGSLESFLGCPSNKTNDKGPEFWSQLAAQLDLGGIRVDTGMVMG